MSRNRRTERPPSFTSLDDQPLPQSLPVVIGTAPAMLKVWAASLVSNNVGWASIGGNVPPVVTGPNTDGRDTLRHSLVLLHYWQQVPGSYTHIYPGETFTKSYELSIGVSDTASETVASELGVKFAGLSARIEQLFSQSITVSAEMTEETQFTVSGPAPGSVRAWVLWQPVYELVAIDPSGAVLAEEQGEYQVAWSAEYGDLAHITVPNARQAFPQREMVPMQKDFPAPVAAAPTRRSRSARARARPATRR